MTSPLAPHQQAFVDLLVEFEVVRFGDFTLKSGRKSPYFVNMGQLRTGAAALGVGRAYAAEIRRRGIRCDLVFGPAYKGIPLAVATAIGLAESGVDTAFGFDRKEIKDHGEGGRFVATAPKNGDHVVLVDDVITSGISVRETVDLLEGAADVTIAGVIVAVDRMERGQSAKTTLAELRAELGVPVFPIVDVRSLVADLASRDVHGRRVVDDAIRAAIDAYLEAHGGEA
jgi:orotate phosphoribosyltransferase